MARFLPDAPIEIVERTIRDWPLRYGAYDVDGLSGLGRDGADPQPARRGPRGPGVMPSCGPASGSRTARSGGTAAAASGGTAVAAGTARSQAGSPALEAGVSRRGVGAASVRPAADRDDLPGPRRGGTADRRCWSSGPANSTTNARISECSVQAACGMSAGQIAASPAAIRVHSSPTPTQPPPSTTMNQVDVRAGVRLDPGVAGERQLGDGAAAVRMDDLAGQPDRTRRARPVADGRRRTGGSRSASSRRPTAQRRRRCWRLAAAAAALLDRGLRVGELLLGEVALAGEARLVRGEDRREAEEADPDQRAEADDLGGAARGRSRTRRATR